MDVCVYQAALLCDECGEKVREDLTAEGKAPDNPDDERTYDSDDFPKGPYPDGGGESDSPQHCDSCGIFLENALTSEGLDYVMETLAKEIGEGGKLAPVMREWVEFYDISLTDLFDWIEGKGEWSEGRG